MYEIPFRTLHWCITKKLEKKKIRSIKNAEYSMNAYNLGFLDSILIRLNLLLSNFASRLTRLLYFQIL